MSAFRRQAGSPAASVKSRKLRRVLAMLMLFLVVPGHARQPGESWLLIAHPALEDPSFVKSVVAVTYPLSDSGPLGVVLNRPLGKKLADVLPEQPGLKSRTSLVYFGGPVRLDHLCFLFRSRSDVAPALRMSKSVFFSNDPAILQALLAQSGDPEGQRFFAGFSSWARGQLEYEIESGAWYVLPMEEEVLFSKPTENLWRDLLLRARAIQTRFSPSQP